MNIKRRQDVFVLSASKINLPIILTRKRSLKAVMTKVIPKIIGLKTPTPKKAVMMAMEK